MICDKNYLKFDNKYKLEKTINSISKEDIKFLMQLSSKYEIQRLNALFAHTVPIDSDNYFYPNSNYSIFDKTDKKYIFIGHTHYPQFISYYEKKIINPGSVSQPRDNLKKSSFIIADENFERIEFIRL